MDLEDIYKVKIYFNFVYFNTIFNRINMVIAQGFFFWIIFNWANINNQKYSNYLSHLAFKNRCIRQVGTN